MLFVRRTLILTLVGFAATVGCTKKNSAPENSNEIRIGQFGSMTGGEASFGQATDKGVRLAIDEKNSAGGINGKKIVLISEDDQGKPEEAAAVVKKLITQDKVIALIGEVASTRSLFAAPIAQQYKVPMVSPSSTNPKVTQVGDYIFRVCFIDPFQGPVVARFAYENLKLRKAAVLKDLKSDYSLGLAEFFTKKFKELGGQIVAEETFQTGDSDFKAQLTHIRAANPDALFIPAYYTEVGLIARQARQLGIKAVLLGGDGWDSPKLFEIGKDAVDGAYFADHYSAESPSPNTQKFIKAYKEKYKVMPGGLDASGYDAALILFEALEKAPDLKPESIRAALAATKDFEGATGKITIDGDRNASKDVFMIQLKDGKYKFATVFHP